MHTAAPAVPGQTPVGSASTASVGSAGPGVGNSPGTATSGAAEGEKSSLAAGNGNTDAETRASTSDIESAVNAIRALQSGTSSAIAADAYLRELRESQQGRSICLSLLHAPTSTFCNDTSLCYSATLFAARSLSTEHCSTQTLFTALQAPRVRACPPALHALAHQLGMRTTPALWGRVLAVAQGPDNGHSFCAFCAALGAGLRSACASRAFLAAVAPDVLPRAVEETTGTRARGVMNVSTDGANGNLSLPRRRSAVQCLAEWLPHAAELAEKCVRALLTALKEPLLAQDVAEPLSAAALGAPWLHEILAKGLARACTSDNSAILHAVAEVTSELAEAAADNCVEFEAPDVPRIVAPSLEVVITCLEAGDTSAFLAAAEAAAAWLSAADIGGGDGGAAVVAAAPRIVAIVLQKLPALQQECSNEDGECAPADLARVLDLLLHAAQALGADAYLSALAPHLHGTQQRQHVLAASAITALAAASDALAVEAAGVNLWNALSIAAAACNGNAVDSRTKSAGLKCLIAYAASSAMNWPHDLLLAAVRAAGTGIAEKRPDAAELLRELATARPVSVREFLSDLLPAVIANPSENAVAGVCAAAATLPQRERQLEVLDMVLGSACSLVRRAEAGSGNTGEDELRVALGIIAGGASALDNASAGVEVLNALRVALGRLCESHATNEGIAPALCRVLVICAMDDENVDSAIATPVSPRDRADLSLWALCTSAQALSHHGADAAWASTCFTLASPLLEALANAQVSASERSAAYAQMIRALAAALAAARSNSDLDTRPDVVEPVLRFAKTALVAPDVESVAGDAAGLAADSLRAANNGVIRAAASWWRAVFSGVGDSTARKVLHAAGGPVAVAAGAMQAAVKGKSKRVPHVVADIIVSMASWLAAETDEDEMDVLRASLRAAVDRRDVPAEGISEEKRRRIRDVLEEGARTRKLRIALSDVVDLCKEHSRGSSGNGEIAMQQG